MGLGMEPLACEDCVAVVNGWEQSHTPNTHTHTHTLLTHLVSLFSYSALRRTGSALVRQTRPNARGATRGFVDGFMPGQTQLQQDA